MTAEGKKLATMTFPMDESTGLSSPTGRPEKINQEAVTTVGGGREEEEGVERQKEAPDKIYARAETTTTMTTAAAGDTPAVLENIVPSILTNMVAMEPGTIQTLSEGGMNVEEAVQRLSTCFYGELRDKQEKPEQSLRTAVISDLKAERLDIELDIDVYDNVVKFQCFPSHHQSVTTICLSLLTSVEHVLRHYRKGGAQEIFLNNLRNCFTSTAFRFIMRLGRKQTELIMRAVGKRFPADTKALEEAQNFEQMTKAPAGYDANCCLYKDLEEAGAEDRQLEKPRHSEGVKMQQDAVGEEQQGANAVANCMVKAGSGTEVERLRHMMKVIATGSECQGQTPMAMRSHMAKVEEGKEREGKLHAKSYRLLQQAATQAVQGGKAGKQTTKQEKVTDEAISASAELKTSKVVGNSKPSNSYAMDTGTPRKGAGGKA